GGKNETHTRRGPPCRGPFARRNVLPGYRPSLCGTDWDRRHRGARSSAARSAHFHTDAYAVASIDDNVVAIPLAFSFPRVPSDRATDRVAPGRVAEGDFFERGDL